MLSDGISQVDASPSVGLGVVHEEVDVGAQAMSEMCAGERDATREMSGLA
jgi:hypothetical protein